MASSWTEPNEVPVPSYLVVLRPTLILNSEHKHSNMSTRNTHWPLTEKGFASLPTIIRLLSSNHLKMNGNGWKEQQTQLFPNLGLSEAWLKYTADSLHLVPHTTRISSRWPWKDDHHLCHKSMPNDSKLLLQTYCSSVSDVTPLSMLTSFWPVAASWLC